MDGAVAAGAQHIAHGVDARVNALAEQLVCGGEHLVFRDPYSCHSYHSFRLFVI
ncbi:hypothetical protein D3C81_2120860 [compost metagenome]